eukprot:gene5619-4020_t
MLWMQLRILLWLGYALLGLSFSLRPRSLCGVKTTLTIYNHLLDEGAPSFPSKGTFEDRLVSIKNVFRGFEHLSPFRTEKSADSDDSISSNATFVDFDHSTPLLPAIEVGTRRRDDSTKAAAAPVAPSSLSSWNVAELLSTKLPSIKPSSPAEVDVDASADLLSSMQRLVRRRILNVLDRSSPWANAISHGSASMDAPVNGTLRQRIVALAGESYVTNNRVLARMQLREQQSPALEDHEPSIWARLMRRAAVVLARLHPLLASRQTVSEDAVESRRLRVLSPSRPTSRPSGSLEPTTPPQESSWVIRTLRAVLAVLRSLRALLQNAATDRSPLVTEAQPRQKVPPAASAALSRPPVNATRTADAKAPAAAAAVAVVEGHAVLQNVSNAALLRDAATDAHRRVPSGPRAATSDGAVSTRPGLLAQLFALGSAKAAAVASAPNCSAAIDSAAVPMVAEAAEAAEAGPPPRNETRDAVAAAANGSPLALAERVGRWLRRLGAPSAASAGVDSSVAERRREDDERRPVLRPPTDPPTTPSPAPAPPAAIDVAASSSTVTEASDAPAKSPFALFSSFDFSTFSAFPAAVRDAGRNASQPSSPSSSPADSDAAAASPRPAAATPPAPPPLPSKADFAFLQARMAELALQAALAVKTERDAQELLKDVGLSALLDVLLGRVAWTEPRVDAKIDAVRALCRLVRAKPSLAAEVGAHRGVVDVLTDLLEAPLALDTAERPNGKTTGGGGGAPWRLFPFHASPSKAATGSTAAAANAANAASSSPAAADARRTLALRAQYESLALVHRLVRTSDAAVEHMRLHHPRLRRALYAIMTAPDAAAEAQRGAAPSSPFASIASAAAALAPAAAVAAAAPVMARVSHWGLGGVPWTPRRPGQRGVRILSFDGGGTRGVVSIAYLKALFQRLGPASTGRPCDYFDIICGTSTGGIIAMLLGAQRRSVADSETLYDEFIGKIFASKSNLKLVTAQAAYDETEFEKILFRMCGESLLLDTNQDDCARVFCASTKVNTYPPTTQLWRNYHYPPPTAAAPAASSRYPGSYRVNTLTAVRATTAAPTFFTPVVWEGSLFCDGGLVANNPTAIALQEAKLLYPGVPIECVVSIGTGLYRNQKANMQSMGWDTLVQQLIASSTDTEDVHGVLADFLAPTQYYRFNALFPDEIPIDVKDRAVLNTMKSFARQHFDALETGPEAARYEALIRLLRGDSDSGGGGGGGAVVDGR